MSTTNEGGKTNTALYTRPFIADEETVAWCIPEGRTYLNLIENPKAAYLYMNPGSDYSGVRLDLTLKGMETPEKLPEHLTMHSEECAEVLRHVAYFTVNEITSLS